jgi:hypothetical protein
VLVRNFIKVLLGLVGQAGRASRHGIPTRRRHDARKHGSAVTSSLRPAYRFSRCKRHQAYRGWSKGRLGQSDSRSVRQSERRGQPRFSFQLDQLLVWRPPERLRPKLVCEIGALAGWSDGRALREGQLARSVDRYAGITPSHTVVKQELLTRSDLASAHGSRIFAGPTR